MNSSKWKYIAFSTLALAMCIFGFQNFTPKIEMNINSDNVHLDKEDVPFDALQVAREESDVNLDEKIADFELQKEDESEVKVRKPLQRRGVSSMEEHILSN